MEQPHPTRISLHYPLVCFIQRREKQIVNNKIFCTKNFSSALLTALKLAQFKYSSQGLVLACIFFVQTQYFLCQNVSSECANT